MNNKINDKILVQSIDRLDVSDKVIATLKTNNIKTLGQLCRNTKTDLKGIDLLQIDINKIQIQLQLLGLNLKGGL